MTDKAKQVQLSFVGSFLGALIPVATFAYWLGQVSARVDTLESEVTRLRDKAPAALAFNPWALATFTKYDYEELPDIPYTELPLR